MEIIAVCMKQVSEMLATVTTIGVKTMRWEECLTRTVLMTVLIGLLKTDTFPFELER